MTPTIPLPDLEQKVKATMKPPRPSTTACACGQNPATLRHLAGCPAVMPNVREWAKVRAQRVKGRRS